MQHEDVFSFPYRYPFSEQAKLVILAREADTVQFTERYLEMAKSRLEEAFSRGKLEYNNIAYGKLDYIISYVYERMLVSAIGSRAAIVKFAAAEAARSRAALESSDDLDMLLLSSELGLTVAKSNSGYKIRFDLLLRYMSSTPGFSLSNFKLHVGEAVLNKHEVAGLLENVIFRRILKGLPIKHSDLPQRVVAISKSITPPAITIKSSAEGGSRAWIDKLLETPIPDMRHRVVNLVLAPYLVNIKGLSEDDASKAISAYVERCKELDPNTKINDSYIKYQCAYSKKRNLKPLSLVRAKELLGAYVNFDMPKEKMVEK